MYISIDTCFEMELVGPVPNDSVFCTSVGYLILEDIIASRSISIFIKSDGCSSTTYKCLENNVSKALVRHPIGLIFLKEKNRR